MSYKEKFAASPDGTTLFHCQWDVDAPGGVVLLLHGYADHSGRYEHVAEHLNEAGFSVVSFDLRGMGRSKGRPGHIESYEAHLGDVETVMRTIDEEYDCPKVLLGHSFGGVLATLYLARGSGPSVSGLILSSPAFKLVPNRVLQPLAGALARFFPNFKTPGVNREAISRDRDVVEAALSDPLVFNGRIDAVTGNELLRAGRRALECADKLSVPLLAFHGSSDKIADPAATDIFVQNYGGSRKRFELLDGYYHEPLNEPSHDREHVLKEITAFVQSL